MADIYDLGYNLLAVAAMMIIGWFVSLYQRNVTIVDSLWGAGFVLIAWMTWFQMDGFNGRQLLLAGLTTAWGVRLSVYLTWRNLGKSEDSRYASWRKAHGNRFWFSSLYKVFFLQALVLWLIALPIQTGQASRQPAQWGITDFIGIMVWGIGFVFETIGDWQLARFKSKSSNHMKVMKQGLWRYTRHPNYFGEFLIWWGVFIIVVSNHHLWWTVISPIIVTFVLLKLTGVALTEKIIVKKRPEYKAYIESTASFFPWVPKK